MILRLPVARGSAGRHATALTLVLALWTGCTAPHGQRHSAQTIEVLSQTIIPLPPKAEGLRVADLFRWIEIQIDERVPDLDLRIVLSGNLPLARAYSDGELSELHGVDPVYRDRTRPPRKGDPEVLNLHRASALDVIRYWAEVCGLEYRIGRTIVVITPGVPTQ